MAAQSRKVYWQWPNFSPYLPQRQWIWKGNVIRKRGLKKELPIFLMWYLSATIALRNLHNFPSLRYGLFPGANFVVQWGWVGQLPVAAPWEARCYPSGQITKIFASLRGCLRHLNANLNHEPLNDTIVGITATLTTRPLRKRFAMVFGGIFQWKGLFERKGEKIVAEAGIEPAIFCSVSRNADHCYSWHDPTLTKDPIFNPNLPTHWLLY